MNQGFGMPQGMLNLDDSRQKCTYHQPVGDQLAFGYVDPSFISSEPSKTHVVEKNKEWLIFTARRLGISLQIGLD